MMKLESSFNTTSFENRQNNTATTPRQEVEIWLLPADNFSRKQLANDIIIGTIHSPNKSSIEKFGSEF
jgi:hypothetical protein